MTNELHELLQADRDAKLAMAKAIADNHNARRMVDRFAAAAVTAFVVVIAVVCVMKVLA